MKGHKKQCDAPVSAQAVTNNKRNKSARDVLSSDGVKSAKKAKTENRGVVAKFRERIASRFRVVFSDEQFTEKAQTVGAYSAAFMAAFLVALVSASTFTPLDNSEAADTVNVRYNATGYYINMATTGTVNMSIEATPDGAMAVAKDTVNVKTNSKTYKIYVSMNSSEANGNRLNLGGSAGASSYFAPVNGSATAPVALGNNTWGWSLALDNVNASDTTLSSYGFNDVYTMSDGTTSDGQTGQALNTNQKFAAMPLIGSEALIASGTAATTSGTNYDVYYGAKANTALASGTYSNTVLYTAVGEASSSAAGEASIAPDIQTTLDPDSGSTYGKGQEVTIATSMYTSEGLDLGTVSATIGGKECTNIRTGVSEGGTVNITCNAPEALTWGEYDVVATFTKFDRAYEIHKAYNVYVPYADMASAPAGTYTMQSFTAKTCSEMTTPKAYTGEATILDGGTVNADVQEVTLKDDRDSAPYKVRKLADGNCWMADNLRLSLDDSTALTSETTDIKYNMDTGKGLTNGDTTTPRTISNPLKANGPVLGTYSTDSSSGVISWTPYKDSQYGTTTTGEGRSYNISWGSPFSACSDSNGDGKIVPSECTMATTGTAETTAYAYFSPDDDTGAEKVVVPTADWYTNNNAIAEFARSYDNEQGRSGGTTMNDGDGRAQYYGTYYNWYAATAGSGTWAMTSGDAKNSVCPRNWTLPKNDSDGSWYDLLYTKYSFTATGSATGASTESTALQKAPFSVVRSGVYRWASGGLYFRGGAGYYWSSHAYATTDSHGLRFAASVFYPQGGDDKIYGFTVRCVVR